MNRVYFDECGNTGQNLVDDQDPIFVLASCRFSAAAEKQVLEHFKNYKGPELKYSRLRRTDAGQRSVLRFLEDSAVESSAAAAFVIHKPFMIVTKYCDVVLEPSVREAGLNFYERGLNIATANLLTTTMPVFLNPKTWTHFLSAFVNVVRERSAGAFGDLIRLAELIHSHLENTQRDMANWFAPVLLLRREEFFETLGDHELDPLVTSYYLLVDHWGKKLGDRFEMCADQSKVLVKERDHLLALADPDIAPVEQGFDRRKMQFPLKIAGIRAVDSVVERQVQLADIIAGVLAGALKSPDRTKEGTFAYRALKLCFGKQFYIDGVWPNTEVDPKKLGTDELPSKSQFDLPTYTMMVGQKHPTTRKPKK